MRELSTKPLVPTARGPATLVGPATVRCTGDFIEALLGRHLQRPRLPPRELIALSRMRRYDIVADLDAIRGEDGLVDG